MRRRGRNQIAEFSNKNARIGSFALNRGEIHPGEGVTVATVRGKLRDVDLSRAFRFRISSTFSANLGEQ